MKLIMLLTAEVLALGPIPESITIEDSFGQEEILDPIADGVVTLASGEGVLIDGMPTDIKEWLRPLEGVWITNNPAMGQWYVAHIKD